MMLWKRQDYEGSERIARGWCGGRDEEAEFGGFLRWLKLSFMLLDGVHVILHLSKLMEYTASRVGLTVTCDLCPLSPSGVLE